MTANVIYRDEDGRLQVESALMRESLIDEDVRRRTISEGESGIMPELNIISIGGQSIIDRGRAALFPLIDAIVRCRERHKLVVGVGGGARVRHTLHVALSLGIPTGGLATLVASVDAQNQRMMGALFAKHKGVVIDKEHFLTMPLLLETGMIPIMSAMPPYHFWEPCAGKRRVPGHSHDLGMYMVAEVTGARTMIYLKDEDGLYTADPKKDPNATFIPRIEARELLESSSSDVIIERSVLMAMLNARRCKRIRIINGLRPELLARALEGEDVGTEVIA